MRPNQPPAAIPSGYVLPLVLIFLIILMVTSASFFSRASDNAKLSGVSKDHGEALVLAESGINLVYGRLTSFSGTGTPQNSTDVASTPCTPPRFVGDFNCDGTKDLVVGQFVPLANPPTLPLTLGYQFFLSDATGAIAPTAPELLQKIADGEGRNAASAAPTSQAISNTNQYLRVNDLFISGTIRPMLFTKGTNGLTFSSNTWQTETSPEKVAVWVEITKSSTSSGSYDFYLCAAAQVGDAKAYLLRYLSTANWTLGSLIIAPISESANHG